ITIISGVVRLFREGDNLNAGGGGGFNEKTALWMKLKGNTLYYLFADLDQAEAFDQRYVEGNGEVTQGYTGIVPSNLSFEVVSGKKQDKRITWIGATLMMEADNH